VARKPTAQGEIKALIKAHAGYKAVQWRCTGRHRYKMKSLSIATPLSCPNGHSIRILREMSIKEYLKQDIQRIKEKYASSKQQFELRA
jgi:hypothetical protein